MCDDVGDRRDYRRVWCLRPVGSHFPFQLYEYTIVLVDLQTSDIIQICLCSRCLRQNQSSESVFAKSYPEKQTCSDPFRDLKEGWLTSPRGRNSQLSPHSFRHGCTGERWMNS